MTHPTIQACRELLTATADADLYDEKMDELHALAIDILARTGHRELHATIEWHTGCHCHGQDHTDKITTDTLEEMAQEIAGHPHADEGDLDKVHWVVKLTGNEHSDLFQHYKARADYLYRLKVQRETVRVLETKLRNQTGSISRALNSLAAMTPELTPEAQATRRVNIDQECAERDETVQNLAAAKAHLTKLEAEGV
jgi:hypothetical protein